jgi:hypothetical protein
VEAAGFHGVEQDVELVILFSPLLVILSAIGVFFRLVCLLATWARFGRVWLGLAWSGLVAC